MTREGAKGGKKKRKKVQGEKEQSQQMRNARRASTLLQEYQLARAAKALVSSGVDQTSAAAWHEMEAKHPQLEVPEPPQEENTVSPISFNSREVYEAIASFKAGTAAGPSGLKAEHLKEAKGRGEGRGAATLGALTRLVNTMTKGLVPKEVAPYFFGANLFALIKKTGGHRPVAVGNILRRLTSKCVARKESSAAAQRLRPLQLGVGVRGGCEALVHATRAMLTDPTIPAANKWCLQVDFENGYNLMNRSTMVKENRLHHPATAPWVESAYGVASVLNFGEGGSLLSTTGGHQGDPYSSHLFANNLQPVVEKLEQVEGLVMNGWFHDDGVLIGSMEALREAWDILEREGVPRGLYLSGVKSSIYCPDHDPMDLDPLGRGVTRIVARGFKLLGAPVGDHDFEEVLLVKRLVSIRHLLDHLHLLDDPHQEYVLLRSCLSIQKFAYNLRTVDTSGHPGVLRDFDTEVRGALEGILGTPLTPSQWSQASLPCSKGGLGLRLAASHGPGAYLASVGSSDTLVQEVRRRSAGEEHEVLVEQEVPVERALENLNCLLGEPLSKEEVLSTSQRQLSTLVDTEAAARLLQAACFQREEALAMLQQVIPGDEAGEQEASAGLLQASRDLARFRCVARAGAADWLNAIPNPALGLHLRKTEFLTGVKLRLGLPVFREEGPCPASRCKANSDVFGIHAISCAYGGERIAKHQHLRDAVFNAAVQANIGPVREADGLLPGSNDRPADVLLRYWHQGRDACLDVTVVNPLCASLVDKVAKDGDAGVGHAHKAKLTKYWDRCQAQGLAFLPMAVDVFGGWHKEGLATLSKLGGQLARALGKPEGEVVAHLRQRVGVVLVRDSVAMLASRAPTFPPGEVDGSVDEG